MMLIKTLSAKSTVCESCGVCFSRCEAKETRHKVRPGERLRRGSAVFQSRPGPLQPLCSGSAQIWTSGVTE